MRSLSGMLLSLLFLIVPSVSWAQSLDDHGAPTSPDSAMYTLDDIYNRLDTGAAGTKRAGAFTEPSAGPAPTGPTLDNIMGKAPAVDDANGAGVSDVANGKTFWGLKSGEWGLKTGTGTIATYPAPVSRTGQTPTVPFAAPTGSDGDLEKGVAWPSPRFTDNINGTVTDNLTGLIWLQNANKWGAVNWNTALNNCSNLAADGSTLTDGSVAGDWRLPNIMELLSLIDWRYYDPALCNAAGTGHWSSGDAFTGVQSIRYWSSTTYAGNTSYAWGAGLTSGGFDEGSKTDAYYVWPVRNFQ